MLLSDEFIVKPYFTVFPLPPPGVRGLKGEDAFRIKRSGEIF
jgi:hypothetical protein